MRLGMRLPLLGVVAAAAALASVRAAGACTFPPFYAAEERPIVHQVELLMPKTEFRRMIDNQGDRNFPEIPATILFDGERLPGGKIQVHGGTPQRGGFGDGGGADCRIGSRDGADGLPTCKPSA